MDRTYQYCSAQRRHRQAIAKGTYNANLLPQLSRVSPASSRRKHQHTNYNGLQAGLRVENKRGLTLQFAYTWSHEIDIVSNEFNVVSNPFDLAYDRGSGQLRPAPYLQRKLPVPFALLSTQRQLFQREVLGGWQFSGIRSPSLGVPFAPTYGQDVLGFGRWHYQPALISTVAFAIRST